MAVTPNPPIVGGGGAGDASEAKQDELIGILDNYATRLDEASTASVTYVGKTDPGNALLTGSAVWAIQRIDETTADTIIAWADGNDLFDNIWDNRLALSYS